MSIVKRNTVVAVMVETTEGTPVPPGAATDYVPVRGDFDLQPVFETIENEELKAGIGPTKPVQGFENPTSSIPLYLKPSGATATAPDAGKILKSAFGNEEIAAAEYNTVASSTVDEVKVDTGEGASYRRGEALLVQHPANDWEIRPIKDIIGDDVTPLFNLNTVPDTGVDLGRAVTYYPAQSGHDALSIWQYLGNGGSTQMITGARPTSLGINFTAGQPITMDFGLAGLEAFWNPLRVTSSNKYIEVDEDAGGDVAVSITEKTYKDPYQLAQALQDALNNSSSLSGAYVVAYSSTTGKYTITVTGPTTLDISWKTGTTHGADNGDNHIGSLLGFSDAADDTGALTYTGDDAIDLTSPYTPTFDDVDLIVAKNLQCLLGSPTDTTCFAASSVAFQMDLERGVNDSICKPSGRDSSLITGRSASASVSAILRQYEAENFKRMRANDEVGFMVAFGTKSGNNWQKTKAGCLSLLSATIGEINLSENNGVYVLNATINAFINNSSQDEVALSFV